MDHLLELLAYLHKSTFERSNKQGKLSGYPEQQTFCYKHKQQKEKLLNKS